MNREKILLSDKWKFHLGENSGAWFMGFDDNEWQSVSVPHDWAVRNPFSKENSSGTGYVCGGTGWYRRRFELGSISGKRVYITFEGVYNNSQIWINSNYMGKRPYGYATFTHDITEFVREGENVVCVKVNHTDLADSRWYTGSGIVRPVYLTITDEAAVVPDGIQITTPFVSPQRAQVNVRVETTVEGVRIANTVLDCFGRSVAGCEGGSIEINNPRLWDVNNPNLYTLKTDIFLGGNLTDTVETTFGVREIRFDADKGFFLNGESMKIKGVCLHHDGGCLGAAVPKSVWRSRLETLRECGCNAIRTSHNPPDIALLDLCDEMGFLVMDEAFDEWEGPKNKWWQGHNVYPPKHYGYYEDFHEWGEKDIKMMVRRDRNHPCIIMWSIGNEVDYPNDPYVHPLFGEVMGNNDANKPARERMYDPKRPDASRLVKIAEKLVKWVKEEDTSRPVTAALAFPELSNETGYADALDIVGYNYKEQFYEQDHRRFKGRVIFGSENSHHIGAWKAVEENDYICAQFLWTGIDYMGEAHGWPVRGSGAGLLDMAGFKKLRFYQRKAMWHHETAIALACRRPPEFDEKHHRPHFVPLEMKWNWNEGEQIEAVCFASRPGDCRLLLNGVDCGEGELEPRMGAVIWRINYACGELKAVCGDAEARLVSGGAATKIEAKAVKNTDDNVIRVEISLLDEAGNPACGDEIICASVENGELLGLENGDIADTTSYTSSARTTRNGRLAAYVRNNGNAKISLRCASLTTQLEL